MITSLPLKKITPMKNVKLLLSTATFFLFSCSVSNKTVESSNTGMDSIPTVNKEKTLMAKIELPNTTEATSPINLKFTVYNHSDSTLSFCKWHTPFEPLMSKYLDVTDESGKEVDYKGPMAKRIMPPPADSYIAVKAGDSISVSTDLKKAYTIDKPGKYTVKYNSTGISGIVIKDSVSFTQSRIIAPPQ